MNDEIKTSRDRKAKWEFSDAWLYRPGVVTRSVESNSSTFQEYYKTNFTVLTMDAPDAAKIADKKIYFGSIKSGFYFWSEGKKNYLHRYFLESDGKDLTNKRVGFVDGMPTNLQFRNLFIYEPADKPLINKWKAREARLKELEKDGLAWRSND